MTTMATKEKEPGVPIISRLADVPAWMGKKSHFLFGPRQTG